MCFFLFSGHIHDARRRSMAVDVVGVLDELYAQLVGFRGRVVADRSQPRRSGRVCEEQQLVVDAVRPGDVLVHLVLPVQRRDPAHDR